MKLKKKKIIDNIKEKINMYDMLAANLLERKSILVPKEKLDNSQIKIGFSSLSSDTHYSKYFIIRGFPDYLKPQFIDSIRVNCIRGGVKINFYYYGEPHMINWDSAEMKNKIRIWKEYADKEIDTPGVFEYRSKREDNLKSIRIIRSTQYLNEAELDYKRSLMKVSFLVEITSKKDDESIINFTNTVKDFKLMCSRSDIKVKELRINMIDWLQQFGIFSLKGNKETRTRLAKKILTDDILANFNGYKQGRVGTKGVCLGIDVLSGAPVLKKFKADPDAPENWLISAETGGGKSYYIKTLLTYLLADNFVVTVMDYEGDEYSNLAGYISAGNPEDVKVISMGKGSNVYFDPMEIGKLTGDSDIDNDLKENSINYTLAIFRTIHCGLSKEMDKLEEHILSEAIRRVYEFAGVTEDKKTWKLSKGLKLLDVYEEVKSMVDRKELVDPDNDNLKHKAAIRIVENSATYFEEGEAKSGTFKNPLSLDDLLKAKFIIFSFGMRGLTASQIDPVILALKQLSVANISIQISNYCKYVRRCFNVKVWEEYQRWGEISSSEEIISNALTGGRKRGDVNFLITNDLASILDKNNPVAKRLRQNIQNMAIGKIKDRGIRNEFCRNFDLVDLEPALERIARANTVEDLGNNKSNDSYNNRYKHSMCLALDSGKRAIVKVMLPQVLRESSLFKTGVAIEDEGF